MIVYTAPIITGGGLLCPQRSIVLSASLGGQAQVGTWTASSGAVGFSTSEPSSSATVYYVSSCTVTITFTSAYNCIAVTIVTCQAACSSIDETGTTCQQIRSGTAVALPGAFYSVRDGKISQVNPGVFFFDSTITAPARTFTVCVLQSVTAGWPLLSIQSADKSSQFIVWSSACVKSASTG